TVDVLERLERRYCNVKVHRLTGGASGSASRPRNVGVEMSSTRYVTFLDPDNSICPGGYDALLSRIENDDDLDAVFGFQIKVTSGRPMQIGRLYETNNVTVKDPRSEVLIERDFPVISTQAAVIRRNVLLENDVHYIE